MDGHKTEELSWWGRVQCNLLLWSCRIAGVQPRWMLYGPLRWVIYAVLYRVVRYRIGVVRTNLRNSFPEKEMKELRAIEREYYRHLSEIFVDAIDMAAVSRRAILRRITITNLEEHEACVAGRDWIAAMSHYGSWEYFSAYQLLTPTQVVGVYHPLESRVFDEFYRRVRTRFGMETVASGNLLRYMLRKRQAVQGNIAVGMIADQTTPWESDHWFDFLNQPTCFYDGPGRLGIKFGMPVYFLHLRKVAPAHYEGWFELIYDGQSPADEHQITARYAALLQKEIREQPPYWIWSHRRWKRPPDRGRAVETLPEV